MYVHGVDLIRARDVNLPPPVNVEYPVYDSTGTNFLGTFYNVQSFATWQMTPSFTCPFPPCINPLARPIPQLGAIDVFESAASSVYNGATLSIRRHLRPRHRRWSRRPGRRPASLGTEFLRPQRRTWKQRDRSAPAICIFLDRGAQAVSPWSG